MTVQVIRWDGGWARCHFAALRLLWWIVHRFLRHRGFQRLTWTLGRVLPRTSSAIVRVGGGLLRIPLWDGYWAPLLMGAPYEPELELVLARCCRDETVFLDCGANIGYWSAWTRGRVRSAIAVEASPPTYDRLAENSVFNDGAFEVVLGAVWSTPGTEVSIVTHAERHAGASAVNRSHRADRPGYTVHVVPTVTIEQLARSAGDSAALIVKLDVEGAELRAMETAWALVESGRAMILYEEHGSDLECATTTRALDLGLLVWLIDEHGAESVNTVEQLLRIKAIPSKGYNVAMAAPTSRFADDMNGMRHPDVSFG